MLSPSTLVAVTHWLLPASPNLLGALGAHASRPEPLHHSTTQHSLLSPPHTKASLPCPFPPPPTPHPPPPTDPNLIDTLTAYDGSPDLLLHHSCPPPSVPSAHLHISPLPPPSTPPPPTHTDPNLLDTLTAYDGSPDFLRTLELDKEGLTKAIIGCMGDIDAYQLPDSKGYSAFSR
jgi:hypothetical protein